jgi:hypothetical protein
MEILGTCGLSVDEVTFKSKNDLNKSQRPSTGSLVRQVWLK